MDSNNTAKIVKRVVISAGELSGDEHAGHLARALKNLEPQIEIKGMGGRNLRTAGVETIVDSETEASVMGFAEVLTSLRKILAALQKIKKLIKDWKPDVLILVDFADFNMRLAKYASGLGIRVLYYIPPQVWAWRSGRIKLFQKYINQIAVIFPFEEEYLRQHGYPTAYFVGHPMPHYLQPREKKDLTALRSKLGLTTAPVLAVFPGSRKAEIKKNLDIIISGMRTFLSRHPEVQILINVAPSLKESELLSVLTVPQLKLVKEDPLDILALADAGLLKSGTSNLQAAVIGLPFAMFYKTSRISAFIARHFVKLKEYSIVNVLEPGTTREILQDDLTPECISAEAERLLFDQEYRKKILSSFDRINARLRINEQSIFAEYDTDSPVERVALLALGRLSN